MKITRITTHLMQAGTPETTAWAADTSALVTSRNWLFVRVHTDAGITGVGEGSGWPRVVETAVKDLEHVLIGEDARDIERLWQKMKLAMMGHGDTGVVGSGAITAIDTALWDIKGQALGTPVWNLLGGRVRVRLPYYAHAKTPAKARALLDKGVTAFKLGGLDRVPERVAEMRDALGPNVDLMVDLHGPPWLSASDAIAIGKELERSNVLFLEDPVAPEDMEGWRRVRRALDIPLAGGERLAAKWGAARLLDEGLVDVIQPDTGRCGGITELRKIAAMAEAKFVQLAPHSGSLGPVAEWAAVHVMAAVPNALFLERLEPEWSERESVLTASLEASNGSVAVPEAPGLGVDIREDVVARFPSTRNTAIAGGGWQADGANGVVYAQPRRRGLRPGKGLS
jgi:galactonate dehydratase